MQRFSDKHLDNLVNLPAALRSFIPEQLLKNVKIENRVTPDELQYVQNVMDNSNENLRMYGSAESLLTNLKVYMEFPLSRKFFQRELGSYYYTIPHFYQTLKKEILFCKQDLLFYLQSCVYTELRIRENAQKLKFAELIEYMKKHEERLGGCYEFVKYDIDVFEDVQEPFLYAGGLCYFPETSKVTVTVEPLRGIPYEEKDFVKVFDNLISKYPCIFLPNSETKDKNATAVVRVFDDGNVKFVMESELFTAINLKNPERKPLKCMDIEGQYRTIDYKHVLELYRDQIDDVDFICHRISMCPYAAVPIVAPTGDHCILAIRAQNDILTETFLTLGVFQKITRNTCHMIPKFVAILEKYLPSNIKYRYFMNLKLFRKLQEELKEFWKPIENKPVKRVRNVGPQGFTLEDLKKELKYLGYTEIFPDIASAARAVYITIIHSHQPNELKTREMFKAIQACQLFSMVKRYPCLNEFVYRQKVCPHNRSKPCEPCMQAIKEAEARIEAEIEAESEQASYTVAETTSEDDVRKEEDSEESKHESVTIEAPSIASNNPVEAETKPIAAISESEVSEHNPVLPDSNNREKYESCLKDTKTAESEQISSKTTATTAEDDGEKEKYSEEFEPESVTNEAPEITNTVKAFESHVQEKDEQLKVVQKPLEEKEVRCKESEKTVKETNKEEYELSETEKSLYQEKEHLKATVNGLLLQLAEKDEEIDELRKENRDGYEKLKSSILEVKRRLNEGLDQQKENDSKMKKLELKHLKLMKEKNEEIEKLKKQLALAAKDNKKEMEQLKRNASKSADELKKLTAKSFEKEAEERQLKRSNEELLEKLRKYESSLQEITNRRNLLETEVTEKNRIILELQKSAEKQVSEQKKAKKELETRISKVRGMLDEISRPEPEPEPVPSDSSENLSIQKLKNLFNAPGPIELAKEMVEKLISLSNCSEIHQMARYELQQYQGRVENYLRELEGKTEKISEFPSISDRFMSEYWKEIDRNSQITLSDSECFICFNEMKFDEEPTLKCEHCRKIVHFECASKWLKIHRSCAHCRREQLDPNEFPRLR